MASLTLKGISKTFGKAFSLSEVDLHVEDGEFCVLLGPSGCGKSTLLNIIAGLLPQDRGSVALDGRSVDSFAPRDRNVAMVFQNYALYPHMTVAKNLGFGLRMHKVPMETIRKRVMETALLLGIDHILDRKPRDLSGGERQRVAMGRALIRRPRLFLLDEPLSNLDARLRANVRLELKELHRRLKATILYVTHDQVEAMTLGEKVVVMRDGEVRQAGSPETIYSFPKDTFVATFIGSPEMNLYRGVIVHREGEYTFQGRRFSIDIGPRGAGLAQGEEAEVGLRPEDVDIDTVGKGGLQARVEMVTHVGSEKYVHARIGDESLTFRVPKDATLRPGKSVDLTVDPARLHIFLNGVRAD